MLDGRNKNLNQQLRNITSSNGVDYLGIADLSLAYNAIIEQGGSFIASFSFSISIGYGLRPFEWIIS